MKKDFFRLRSGPLDFLGGLVLTFSDFFGYKIVASDSHFPVTKYTKYHPTPRRCKNTNAV